MRREARRKVRAMAETGAPRRRKMGMLAVVERDCESVAVRVRKAALPHVSLGLMRELLSIIITARFCLL